jgi:hypothetical protein
VVVPQEEDKQRDKVGKGVWAVSLSIDVVSLFVVFFLVLVVLSMVCQTLTVTAIELCYIFVFRTPPAGEYALDACSTTWGLMLSITLAAGAA